MELRSKNSITEYAKYRMKKCFLSSFFSILGIGLSIYLIVESIRHISFINDEIIKVSRPNFFNGLFTTLVFILTLLVLGLLTLLTYDIISIVKSIKKINYYKKPRFSSIICKEIEYDYKLWQTSAKNTFHSQVIKLKIGDEERLFKTDIIFTNSKKIGLFNIPKVLQSHSYVSKKCYIGYDPNLDNAIVIEIVE